MDWAELSAIVNVLRFVYELFKDLFHREKPSESEDDAKSTGVTGG